MTDPATFATWLADELARPAAGLRGRGAWVVSRVVVTGVASDSAGLEFLSGGSAAVPLGGATVRVDRVDADGPDVWVEVYPLGREKMRELVHLPLTVCLSDGAQQAYAALRREGYTPGQSRLVAAAIAK